MFDGPYPDRGSIQVPCGECGTVFTVYHHKLRNPDEKRGKYCSRACWNVAQKARAEARGHDDLMQCFMARHTKDDSTGCWNAKGFLVHGYGRFSWRGKHLKSHRVAWQLFHGEIPKGLVVCHSCDNRACCNPDHLFLGTHADNLADMRRKGRWKRTNPPLGERNNRAVLTEELVRAIRHLSAGGFSQMAISRITKTDRGTINHVIKGRVWSHVS